MSKRAWFFDYLVKGKMHQSTHVECKPCGNSTQRMGSMVDRLSGSTPPFMLAQTPPTQHICVVRPEDRLHLPFNGELSHVVRTLLSRGKRNIVLDLARVSKIDAAGIGDVVRAYNFAMACNGRLRIANTNPWVRKMLERVGLFERLNPSLVDSQERYCADC